MRIEFNMEELERIVFKSVKSKFGNVKLDCSYLQDKTFIIDVSRTE